MPPQEISSFIITNNLGWPRPRGVFTSRLLVTFLCTIRQLARDRRNDGYRMYARVCVSRDIISIDFCVAPGVGAEADLRGRRGGC